jgi:hypothetical protein
MRPETRHKRTPADGLIKPPVEPGGNLAAWREQRLLRAGVEAGLAAKLAANCALDLHAMIELIEYGCPPNLAARILAPLDHERNPC